MLYTPLLPEAASGTLEPRHTVVPLRVMCPQAELLLGDLTGVDFEARTASVADRCRAATRALARARARARRRAANRACPRASRARALVQVAAGRDQPSEPRVATARGGRRGAGRRRAARAALVRLRRRGLRRRRGARRALRPRGRRDAPLSAAARGATTVGHRRRSAEDLAGDPVAPRRIRRARACAARRRDPRRHDARVGDGGRSRARRRHADPDAHARLDCRSSCESAASRARSPARRSRPRRGRRAPPRLRYARRVGARRLRASAEHAQLDARSADLPARTPSGAATCEEHRRRPPAVRLPDARPGRNARPLQGHRRRHRASGFAAFSAGSSRARTTSTSCRSRNGARASSSTGRCRSSSGATSRSSGCSGGPRISALERTQARAVRGIAPRRGQRALRRPRHATVHTSAGPDAARLRANMARAVRDRQARRNARGLCDRRRGRRLPRPCSCTDDRRERAHGGARLCRQPCCTWARGREPGARAPDRMGVRRARGLTSRVDDQRRERRVEGGCAALRLHARGCHALGAPQRRAARRRRALVASS